MNVGELEELLAMLPADMPVHIATDGGAWHISQVSKRPRHRMPDYVREALGAVTLPDGSHPPALVLRAWLGSPRWWEAWADDVPFEVTGRWPARPRRPRT